MTHRRVLFIHCHVCHYTLKIFFEIPMKNIVVQNSNILIMHRHVYLYTQVCMSPKLCQISRITREKIILSALVITHMDVMISTHKIKLAQMDTGKAKKLKYLWVYLQVLHW